MSSSVIMTNNTAITGANATHIIVPRPAQLRLSIPENIKIGMTTAYAVIFVIALLGNNFGLFVVLKKSSRSTLRSTSATNLFIANMTVADLLLTVTVMPYSVAYLYRGVTWIGGMLGTITCKALFYLIPVSIAATVLTVMLISFDRFYAVFYPLKQKIFRKPKILTATIWILSSVLMLPNALLRQIQFNPTLNVHECVQVWPWDDPNDPTFRETYRVFKIFYTIVFVILYALPLSITGIIYFLICRKLWSRKIPGNATDNNRAAAEKTKRKVVRLLVVIVVVFALCWFPVHVVHFLRCFLPYSPRKLPLEVELFFVWLGHANSAINPCLYILMSENFQRELASTLGSCCPCLRRFNCLPNCPNT